jgi:hypothetical protein
MVSSISHRAPPTSPSSTFGAEDFFKKTNQRILFHKKHQTNCFDTTMSAADGLRGRCLVLGVGNGSNTPLDWLCAQFEQVTIVDYDKAALEEAQKTVSAEKISRLALVHLDITGGMVDQWTQSSERRISSIKDTKPKHFFTFWKRTADEMKELHPKAIPDDILVPGSYSLTISMLLVSQLVGLPILFFNKRICETLGMSEDIPKDSLVKATNLSRRVWDSHAKDLVRWTQPGGRILLMDTISVYSLKVTGTSVLKTPPLQMLDQSVLLHPVLLLQDPEPETRKWELEKDRHSLKAGTTVITIFDVYSLTFKTPLARSGSGAADGSSAGAESVLIAAAGSSTAAEPGKTS